MVGGEKKISILKCKIKGIRTEQRVNGQTYEDTGLRYVKVKGCEYRVEKEQITLWLSNFGEIKSKLTEDVYKESDNLDNDMPLGNGIYSARIKIEKDMPKFMPMQGKRVRLYYRLYYYYQTMHKLLPTTLERFASFSKKSVWSQQLSSYYFAGWRGFRKC